MLFDLHVHTDFSPCSIMSPGSILAAARGLGLDGVCLTDHDTTKARDHIQEGVQSDGLVALVGMEYTTPSGDFLIFGPGRDAPPGLPARRLLQFIKDSGGAAVAAHPFRNGRGCDPVLLGGEMCGVLEGINGRCTPKENRRAFEWSQRGGMPMTGGSDAHSLEELGSAATRFSCPVYTQQDLVRALKSGAFQAQCLRDGAGRLVQTHLPAV